MDTRHWHCRVFHYRNEKWLNYLLQFCSKDYFRKYIQLNMRWSCFFHSSNNSLCFLVANRRHGKPTVIWWNNQKFQLLITLAISPKGRRLFLVDWMFLFLVWPWWEGGRCVLYICCGVLSGDSAWCGRDGNAVDAPKAYEKPPHMLWYTLRRQRLHGVAVVGRRSMRPPPMLWRTLWRQRLVWPW